MRDHSEVEGWRLTARAYEDRAIRAEGLLARGAAQLRAWHAKYGEHQPQWLPPAGDVRWLEDVAPYEKRASAAGGSTVAGIAPAAQRAVTASDVRALHCHDKGPHHPSLGYWDGYNGAVENLARLIEKAAALPSSEAMSHEGDGPKDQQENTDV